MTKLITTAGFIHRSNPESLGFHRCRRPYPWSQGSRRYHRQCLRRQEFRPHRSQAPLRHRGFHHCHHRCQHCLGFRHRRHPPHCRECHLQGGGIVNISSEK